MLSITQRLVRIVSCFFEVLYLLLSVVHDVLPHRISDSRDFLLSAEEKALLAKEQVHLGQMKNPPGRRQILIPPVVEHAVTNGRRLLLVDFENSSQGISEVLFDRQAEIAADLLCCVVSQHKPDFMAGKHQTKDGRSRKTVSAAPSVNGIFQWVQCQGGRKEAADELIEAIVGRFSQKVKIYIVHGGDHRWYAVSEKYGVPHHVVQAGKRNAVNEYNAIKSEWKI